MDLIHSKTVEGFCIVSSDSDYTGIAHRMREEGLIVVGIGKSSTPDAFIGACENFIFEEILNPQPVNKTALTEKSSPGKSTSEKAGTSKVSRLAGLKMAGKIDLSKFKSKVTHKIIDPAIIDSAYEMAYNIDRGAAHAGLFSSSLKKLDSTFDIRNYGYTTFKAFVEALTPRYEIITDEKKNMLVKRRD